MSRPLAQKRPRSPERARADSDDDAGDGGGGGAAAVAVDAAVDAAEMGDLTAPAAVPKTFAELGVCPELCDACAALGWKLPSRIQQEALPVALEGRDIIGLAETGSGKTGAFAMPILQELLQRGKSKHLFAVVLAPTRELAFQISEQFAALGAKIGVNVVTVVGGVDMMAQSIALAKQPHIVVGTPGRVVDHLEHTKARRCSAFVW